jgi:hypothetical protein
LLNQEKCKTATGKRKALRLKALVAKMNQKNNNGIRIAIKALFD